MEMEIMEYIQELRANGVHELADKIEIVCAKLNQFNAEYEEAKANGTYDYKVWLPRIQEAADWADELEWLMR